MNVKIRAISTIILVSGLIFSCGKSIENSESNDHHEHTVSNSGANVKSPRTATMDIIGDNHIHIDYAAPSVRGRQIFGGLVGYGEVWSTGAHSATSISFSKDVLVAGSHVPQGKYALFTIPGEDEWIVILNKNWEQHLADDYDEKDDVLRLNLTPEVLDSEVEVLEFEIEQLNSEEGVIKFRWADVGIQIPVMNAST